MSLLRRRHRKSKRHPNPYANRGLEKFALVATELAEKRPLLSPQSGAPESVVGFTAESQSKWVPVIISPTRNKAIETKNASPVIPERNVSRDQESAIMTAAGPSTVHSATVQPQNDTNGRNCSQMAANGRDRDICNTRNDGKLWPEIIAKVASVVENLAAIARAAKFITTFGMAIAKALASTILLRRCHAETVMAIEESLSENTILEEKRLESSVCTAATGISSSTIPIDVSASVVRQSNIASSSPHRPMTISEGLANEAFDAAHRISSPTTQRPRFKCKFLHEGLHRQPETLSAPSTPKLHNACIAATSSDATVCRDTRTSERRELAEWRSFVRKRRRKEESARIATPLIATGLAMVLVGLLVGQFAAIVGATCWWYMVPSLREALGDKPCATRDNHNNTNNSISFDGNTTSTKMDTITRAGSSKYDFHSPQHHKKVIMDGLLHRDRSKFNT